MEVNKSEIINYLNEFIENVGQSVINLKKNIDDNFLDVLNELLNHKGKIFISGSGTSGIIARRMSHVLSCIEMPVSFIHPSDGLHGASGAVQMDDIVIIISKGGESDDANEFASIARQRGAFIIAVTENSKSTLALMSNKVLLYSSNENRMQEGYITFSNSLCSACITDALVVALMKLRDYDEKKLGSIHPSGAVGKKLRNLKS